MSIEYKVSENGLRIETFPKGLLEINEIIKYFGKLKNDTKIMKNATEIVYFKYVTDFKISYSESELIANSFQEPKALLMIDTTIFVCETDLAYGIGRMLQIFNEIVNPKSKIVVVRSESEIENVVLKI